MSAIKTDIGAEARAVITPFAPTVDVPATDVQRAIEYVMDNAGGGGGGTWGSITGTLSNQTDLQTALDAKAASSHTHTASQVTDLSEAVDDRVAALLVAGTNVTLTYNDGSNTLTIDATASGGVDEHQAALLAAVFN